MRCLREVVVAAGEGGEGVLAATGGVDVEGDDCVGFAGGDGDVRFGPALPPAGDDGYVG